MSITLKALQDLTELCGFTVKRAAPGSQSFILAGEPDYFEGMEYSLDRAFLHMLWVARAQGFTISAVRDAVPWEPNVVWLDNGDRIYGDASVDATVDAMVSRYWRKPEPLEEDEV